MDRTATWRKQTKFYNLYNCLSLCFGQFTRHPKSHLKKEQELSLSFIVTHWSHWQVPCHLMATSSHIHCNPSWHGGGWAWTAFSSPQSYRHSEQFSDNSDLTGFAPLGSTPDQWLEASRVVNSYTETMQLFSGFKTFLARLLNIGKGSWKFNFCHGYSFETSELSKISPPNLIISVLLFPGPIPVH